MTRRIIVDVYSPGMPLSYEGTLSSDKSRNWLDDLSEVGSFDFEVNADHVDAALLADGRLLRFTVDGSAPWWALIEGKTKVSADPNNRKAGRVIAVKGRGALAVTEWGLIYPELGLGRLSPDTRWYGFMSKYYDDSTWGYATELKAYSDPDLSKPWPRAPKDLGDPNAMWIGPADADDPDAWDPVGVPAGHVYLRGGYTVAEGEGGEYRHAQSADDGFIEYVDANKEAEEQGVGLWGVMRSKDILQDEGDHLVAVDAINFDRPVPETNVFGYILSVFRLLGGGQVVGPVVARTSSGTKILAFPDSPPGLTAGHILKIWHLEAQARGVLLFLAIDFDEFVDSNGVEWGKELELSMPVGANGLDLGRQLVEMREVNVRVIGVEVDGDITLTLQAFVPDAPDLSGDVTVAYASNVSALAHDHTPPGGNTVLARTAQGRFYEATDTAAEASWGRRETFLQLGAAPSDPAAQQQLQAYFDDHAEPADVITQVQVEVVDGGPIPGVDFTVGDIITAPDFDGAGVPMLVTGLRTTEDEAGVPIYNLDLETPSE